MSTAGLRSHRSKVTKLHVIWFTNRGAKADNAHKSMHIDKTNAMILVACFYLLSIPSKLQKTVGDLM